MCIKRIVHVHLNSKVEDAVLCTCCGRWWWVCKGFVPIRSLNGVDWMLQLFAMLLAFHRVTILEKQNWRGMQLSMTVHVSWTVTHWCTFMDVGTGPSRFAPHKDPLYMQPLTMHKRSGYIKNLCYRLKSAEGRGPLGRSRTTVPTASTRRGDTILQLIVRNWWI